MMKVMGSLISLLAVWSADPVGGAFEEIFGLSSILYGVFIC
jgi:hypothetical protein